MPRSLIDERGQSVYAVAKGSGIPYTTLNELVNGKKNISECNIKTISALASYFNVSMDSLYNQLLIGSNEKNEPPKIAQTWQEKRYKQYKFPIVQNSKDYDASKIHPLKQRLIFSLINSLKQETRIDQIVLFGGSTTIRCNKQSDIDLAINLKEEFVNNNAKDEISENIQKLCGWNADIIWMDRVQENSKLSNNIKRGVRIR